MRSNMTIAMNIPINTKNPEEAKHISDHQDPSLNVDLFAVVVAAATVNIMVKRRINFQYIMAGCVPLFIITGKMNDRRSAVSTIDESRRRFGR